MRYKRLCYGMLIALILCLPLIPVFFGDNSATQADAKVSEGDALAETRDWDAAISCYSEAIKLNPQLATAYAGRGAAYTELNEFNKAIQDCTEAIRLNPDDAGAYYARSYCYKSTGRSFEAKADWEKAGSISLKAADGE